MNFSKIEYPTCPKCLTIINESKIFSLDDLLLSPYFKIKACPKCKGEFLMKTRIELKTEVTDFDREEKSS